MLGVSTTPVRFPPLEADFELGVGTVIDTIDFWRPLYLDSTDSRAAEERLVNVVAKLRPGVTVAQAQAEMDAIARRQAEEHPEAHEGWEVRVVLLRRQMAEGSRDGVLLLSAATGLLLLIAGASWAIELARPWLPGSLPALQQMTINPSVLAFALASAGLTAAVTGVAPARCSAPDRGRSSGWRCGRRCNRRRSALRSGSRPPSAQAG